jgi:hypothetical protein
MPRGKHPNSLANLKPAMIQPGEVRNPLGINRKRPWTDRYYERSEGPLPEILRRQFNERLGMEVLPPGSTWADAGTLRQHMDAMVEGGTKAAKEIADRIEGKPPQRVEIQGTERKEVTLIVRYEKRNQLSS